jgi:integrase
MPNVSSPVRPPAYRRHKATGQAVVTISGRDLYLGKYNTAASKEAYRRIVGEWMLQGSLPSGPHDLLTVTELVVAFAEYATGYYRKSGEPTNEVRMIKAAIRIVRLLYGRTNAIDFGPLALKACRAEMIRKDWCRSHINKQTDRIKRMFKWATAEEMIPGHVYEALRSVAGLKRGRSGAREERRVQPISDTDVQATLDKLPPVVRDMVQLQRLTGARPAEICDLRPCDVNRSADVWEYVVASHKTQHFGRDRVIFIGPKGQQLLLPYLLRPAESYCFSPREAEDIRRRDQHAARRAPISCGNRPGSNRKAKPRRTPGERYNNHSYGRAIRRAAEKAGVERWSPHRLRHSFATEVRKLHGLEAVQVCLGHTNANISQVYAQRDFAKAAEVARCMG